MKIKELSPSLRPYEKALDEGTEALNDAELLAVILRSGTKGKSVLELSQEILSLDKGKNGLLNLVSLSMKDLTQIQGLGRIKALQILCVCELSKRIASSRLERKTFLRDASQVADYYMENMRHLDHEVVYVLLIDSRCRFLKSRMISQGTIDTAAVSSREVIRFALENNAAGFILVHNHPSGEALPSEADIRLSRNLLEAGNVTNVFLKDSVIIGNGEYYSLLEKGYL